MGNETFLAVGMLMSKELVINVGKDTYKIDLTAVHGEVKLLTQRIINNIVHGEEIVLDLDDVQCLERIVKAPLVFSQLQEMGIDLSSDENGNIYAGKLEDGLFLNEGELDMITNQCDGGIINNVNAIRNMVKLKKKLRKQTSYVVTKRLFDFAKCNSLEITDDGNILAYKVIRNDYKDCHTGRIDNSVGAKVSMPRNHVDDDDNATCSSGLHVCSAGYIRHFGNSSTRLVQVEVKPKDFVSIPMDYNDSKARVCAYKVVKEFTADEALEVLGIDLTPERYEGEHYHDMTDYDDDYNSDDDYDEDDDICPDCDYTYGNCECDEGDTFH